MVSEAIDEVRSYVQIEDYSNLTGVSFEARRYFIDNMEKLQKELDIIKNSEMWKTGATVRALRP